MTSQQGFLWVFTGVHRCSQTWRENTAHGLEQDAHGFTALGAGCYRVGGDDRGTAQNMLHFAHLHTLLVLHVRLPPLSVTSAHGEVEAAAEHRKA